MQFLPLVTHNCENLNIPINKTRITVSPKPTKFNTILVITPHSNHTNNQCQTSFISKTQQQRDTGDGSVRKSHQLWRVSKLVFYQLWRNDHVLHYLWSFMVVVVGRGGDGGGGGAAQLSGLEPSWRSRCSGSSHCGSDSQSRQGEGPLSLTLSPTLVQSGQCLSPSRAQHALRPLCTLQISCPPFGKSLTASGTETHKHILVRKL